MRRFLRFAAPSRLSGICILFLFAEIHLLGCKSKPEPVAVPEKPVPPINSSLVFERVEADDPGFLHLSFSLGIENPFPSAGRAYIEFWHVELNGQMIDQNTLPIECSSCFNLILPGEFSLEAAVSGQYDRTIPSSALFPLALDMDVEALTVMGLAPADEYSVVLILDLETLFESDAPQKIRVSGTARFPGVQAPVFSITSIAILKAELINTRFRVGLKIDNPNPYPVELSAFGYELYGNGRLWADGIEKDIIRVNGKSSLHGNLFLIMNFINMKRDLLDQIINLEDVNYRFTGEALVSTSVDYLPKFQTGFDLSGYSQVFDN